MADSMNLQLRYQSCKWFAGLVVDTCQQAVCMQVFEDVCHNDSQGMSIRFLKAHILCHVCSNTPGALPCSQAAVKSS